MRLRSLLCVVTLLGLAASPSAADESTAPEEKTDAAAPAGRPARIEAPELTPKLAARLAQNPLSNILAMPIVDDISFRSGEDNDQVANTLELRPILAFPVRRWRIVTRWAIPISRIPDVSDPDRSAHGLGDIDMTTWVVPPQSGDWTFGLGLAKGFATATDPLLSRGGWSLGPAAIAVFERGRWTASMQLGYEYSWTDDSQFYFQQLLAAYELGGGWALITDPLIVGAIDNPSGSWWSVPIGGGIQKAWTVGRVGLVGSVQAYYNAVRPDFQGAATLQLELTILMQGIQPRDWIPNVKLP